MTAALLAAIAESPDDDDLRLAYADGLDDHGDHAGAEHVRVQCEMAQLVPEDWRWAELAARATELEKRAPRLERGVEYRRGVPGHLDVGADELLERGPDLYRRYPLIESVRISGTVQGRIAPLLASGLLDRVRHLRIEGCGTTGDELSSLAASPRLASLRTLELSHFHQREPAPWYALAHSPHLVGLTSFVADSCEASVEMLGTEAAWPALRRLRVLERGLAAHHVERIAASPMADHLELLAIESGKLGEAGARAIGRMAALRWLSLRFCDVDNAMVAAFAGSPGLGQLETLSLAGGSFGPTGIAALGASPHLGNLARIRFHSSADGVLAALARARSLPALAYIEAGEARVTDDDLRAVAAEPLAAHLMELGLARTSITADGAAVIAESMTSLRSLDTSSCRIGGHGAAAIATAPDSQLERVNMGWARIRERGGVGWLKCPYADQLRSLRLSGNGIPERIQTKLRERYPAVVTV